jgi:hypothetical protein
MVATVAMLAILTFAIPATQSTDSLSASAVNAYSTDSVVLGGGSLSDDQVSDNDVLATLYDNDDDVVK